MSESVSTAAVAGRGSVRSQVVMRGLVVTAVSALAMLVADYAVSYLVVFAFLGNPVVLFGVPIAAVVLAAVISGISKSVTGRPQFIGAIGATVILASIGAYGFMNGVLSPLSLQQDWPIHLAVCMMCALSLGLRTGPWSLRIVGAAALAGVITLVNVLPTTSERAAVETGQAEEEHAAELLEYFLADGTFPVVTGLDGWRNARLRATGSDAITWMVSNDGAVADVLVTGNVRESEMDPLAPCTWISRPGDGGSATEGVLPEWCLRTESGWARVDGTGISFFDNGRLIAVNTSSEGDIRDSNGRRPASAEEIAALALSLRPMTMSEIDEHVLPTYAGLESPLVNTTGL